MPFLLSEDTSDSVTPTLYYVIQVAIDLVFFPPSNLRFCVSSLKQTHLIIAILMPNSIPYSRHVQQS